MLERGEPKVSRSYEEIIELIPRRKQDPDEEKSLLLSG